MKPEDRIEYARIVWQEWCTRRGDEGLGLMSSAEWDLLAGWMDAEIPLRIVLRGIQDCAGKITARTQLMYVSSSVEEAVAQWRKAVA